MASNQSKNISQFTDIILDSISDGVFTIDMNWKITSFNRAAETITGISKDNAVGHYCCDVFCANICENDCAMRDTLKTGKPWINKTIFIVNSKGEQVPASISTALLTNENKKIIGGVETFRDLSMLNELRKELEDRYAFADIISKNKRMLQIFDILPQIAESESTILIEGESGTGKELFARVIHNLSKRKSKKIVAVNCSAIPDTLLESELFGYKAGAFTDAKKDKLGRFAMAEKSSLFLDEIGDITPALQMRLLRVLQEKVYEPLGGTKSVKSDVRIIAATNKHLDEEVKKGNFRHDLFYRINVFKLTIPPLRERIEDIPLLIRHFITKHNRIQDKNISDVSPKVLQTLMSYKYPGNVRELDNIVEHAFVLCNENIIRSAHLPGEMQSVTAVEDFASKNNTALGNVQASYILSVLEKNNWNRQATARELGVHKTTLFRKMKALGIKPPDKY